MANLSKPFEVRWGLSLRDTALITTNQASVSLFPTVATDASLFAAGTSISVGSASGTFTVNNANCSLKNTTATSITANIGSIADLNCITLTAGTINPANVTTPTINGGTITDADIIDGTITGTDILNGTIEATPIGDSLPTTGKFTTIHVPTIHGDLIYGNAFSGISAGANRVLSLGDFGPTPGNLTIADNGLTVSSTTPLLGNPTPNGNIINVTAHGATQLLMGVGGTAGETVSNYIRSLWASGVGDVDGIWSPWAKILTDQNIGDVYEAISIGVSEILPLADYNPFQKNPIYIDPVIVVKTTGDATRTVAATLLRRSTQSHNDGASIGHTNSSGVPVSTIHPIVAGSVTVLYAPLSTSWQRFTLRTDLFTIPPGCRNFILSGWVYSNQEYIAIAARSSSATPANAHTLVAAVGAFESSDAVLGQFGTVVVPIAFLGQGPSFEYFLFENGTSDSREWSLQIVGFC